MPEIKLVPLEQIPWEECFAFQARHQMSEEHIHQLYELVNESDEEQQQKGVVEQLLHHRHLFICTVCVAHGVSSNHVKGFGKV